MKKYPLIILVIITLILSSCSNFYNDLVENIKTVEYTVEHYKQTPDGKGYEILKSETEKQSGTANTKTKAEANNYRGFIAKQYSQQNISPNGDTVVKIYYDRKTITLSFDFAGGKDSDGQENLKISGLYGSVLTLPAPIKKGFLVESWKPVVPETFPAENSSYEVLWKEGDTTYTVHHFLQNIEGTAYEERSEDLQQVIGITNSKTLAEAKTYTGFTARDFSQKSINADGSTDISIYYDRKVCTYTFNSNSGNWNDNLNIKTIKKISGLYGSTVQTMDAPVRTGYSFKSWDSSIPEIYGTEDLTFNANWNANTNTVYTVEHWQQNINDDDYTRIDSDSQLLAGTTDTMTAAAVKVYEGFTAKAFEQKNISADNSTVIQIYYDRKITSYTFNANNGTWNDNSTAQTVSGRYGKTVNVPVPARTGYHFSSWDNSVPLVFGKDNLNFSANWTPNCDTLYKVEHWQQNINNDNYTQLIEDTQTLSGTTAENTAASAKTYAGFSAKNFTQKEIAADGSTVIKVYYDRNIINYTFSANGGNWNGSTANRTISGKFGAIVSVPSNPECIGYTFTSWDQDIPTVFGKSDASLLDTTFTAGWSANTDTRYTVEHWQQNVTGMEYTRVETDTQPLTGITDTQTEARAKNYTGFTAKDFSQGIIAPDGSTIVKVFYDRNTITYTFNPNGGNWSGNIAAKTISGRYGAPISTPSKPVKTGYTFSSWGESVPAVFGSSDKIFTSNWTPNTNTAYTVEHWQQDVTGSGYTKVEADTQYLTGTTDTSTTASAKTYTGFTAKSFSQGTIAGNGNTVVRINYDRKTVTYTFNAGEGKFSNNSVTKTISGRYGASVSKPANPTRVGYTFGSWSNTIPTVFGLENLMFTTSWTPNTNTQYKVEHWIQNVDDDNYTKDNTQTLTGTTAAQTNASVKSYTGFTAQTFTQDTIAANGSTIIKIFYDRNIITYTFNAFGGTFGSSDTVTISNRFGSTVSIPNAPEKPQHDFKGWNKTIPQTFGDEDISFNAKWEYSYYQAPVILDAGTDGTAGTKGTYVYFGVWPQSKKTSDVTVNESFYSNIAGQHCVLGSDNNWYAMYIGLKQISDTIKLPVSGYYKIEPIKWRVLTDNYNGTRNALLLAENILTANVYGTESNNYKNSSVREYLNSTFLNNAFTDSAIKKILTTKIVNNIRSTKPNDLDSITAAIWHLTENAYVCENTTDKIFLLSEQEVTNSQYSFSAYNKYVGVLGLTKSNRIRRATDFAQATSAWQSSEEGLGGIWWLRSPNWSEEGKVYLVNEKGRSDGYTSYDMFNIGVVPALTVTLP